MYAVYTLLNFRMCSKDCSHVNFRVSLLRLLYFKNLKYIKHLFVNKMFSWLLAMFHADTSC